MGSYLRLSDSTWGANLGARFFAATVTFRRENLRDAAAAAHPLDAAADDDADAAATRGDATREATRIRDSVSRRASLDVERGDNVRRNAEGRGVCKKCETIFTCNIAK